MYTNDTNNAFVAFGFDLCGIRIISVETFLFF